MRGWVKFARQHWTDLKGNHGSSTNDQIYQGHSGLAVFHLATQQKHLQLHCWTEGWIPKSLIQTGSALCLWFIIQGRGKMMLLAENKPQIGMAKGPIQSISDRGSKGQGNIQATEKPLTWRESPNNATQRAFWIVRQSVISLGGPTQLFMAWGSISHYKKHKIHIYSSFLISSLKVSERNDHSIWLFC